MLFVYPLISSPNLSPAQWTNGDVVSYVAKCLKEGINSMAASMPRQARLGAPSVLHHNYGATTRTIEKMEKNK
jgi:hypothetical protein